MPDSEPNGLAITCSGGGIRSAAFSLGGLQSLGESGELAHATHISAVSGGSYIAAAYCLAASKQAALDGTADDDEMGPYSLGSPEERHLRGHSRYLMPDWAVGVRAIFFLVGGIVANLLLLLPWLFLGTHVLGRFVFRHLGSVSGLATGHLHAFSPGEPAIWATLGAGLLTVAVFVGEQVWCIFTTERPPVRRQVTRATLRAGILTACLAAVLIGAPYGVQKLNHIAVANGNGSYVTRLVGFAPSRLCGKAASVGTRSQLCGYTPKTGASISQNVKGAKRAASKDALGGTGATSLIASLIGLLTLLARGAVGSAKAKPKPAPKPSDAPASGERPDSSDDSSIVGSLRGLSTTSAGQRVIRAVSPWAGTLVVVATAVVLGLRWTLDGEIEPLPHDLPAWIVAGAAIVAGKLLIDVNRTSLHRFYVERLQTAYGFTRSRRSVDHPNAGTPADLQAHDPETRLSDLRPNPDGRLPQGWGLPHLVICATANLSQGQDLPVGRSAVGFTFTPYDVGLSAGRGVGHPADAGRRVSMREYEDYCGINSMSLFDAVAVSGAALSPLMGRLTRPGLRIFFTIVNIRLGVWLPNPAKVHEHLSARDDTGHSGIRANATRRRHLLRARHPGAQALFREMTGSCGTGNRWLFVTDGGHLDNLGLLEALRRRPSEVIVIDASADHVGTWAVLGEAIALVRTDLGAEITLDTSPATLPDGRGYVHGHIRYADNTEAQLWVAKAVKGTSADLPWDVYAYQDAHPHFPDDATTQQLYGEEEFEAYRALGHCIVGQVLTAREAARKAAIPEQQSRATITLPDGAEAASTAEL
jgi:hypothetical protein